MSSPAPLNGVVASKELFKDVVFFINDSLRPVVRQQIHNLLVDHGATPASPPRNSHERFQLGEITHLITDTLDLPERNALKAARVVAAGDASEANKGKGKAYETSAEEDDVGNIKIVLPTWATRSYDLQQLQQPRFYSPDRAKIFSGLCFCTSELPVPDVAAIAAGVTALGGQWRAELTREVTHLFVVSPSGPKFEMAMKHGHTFGMVVLLPHWFEECLKLGQLSPIDLYRFPEPPLIHALRTDNNSKQFEERLSDFWKAHPALQPPKAGTSARPSATSLLHEAQTATAAIFGADLANAGLASVRYQSSIQAEGRGAAGPSTDLLKSRELHGDTASSLGSTVFSAAGAPLGSSKSILYTENHGEPIFKNHRVYLASDLGVRPGLEAALKNRIEEAGGICWSWGVNVAQSTELGQLERPLDPDQTNRKDAFARRRLAERELKQSDIVVTRTREGWEYWHAAADGTGMENSRTIGNISWLYHVLANGKLDSPLDRMLHYPLPSTDGVPDFVGKTITITNYVGAARDYVRTMVESLGATFEGSMSKATHYVVTASEYGNKVKHARAWGIPLVSHLWLEACLAEWRFIDPATSSTFLSDLSTCTNFTSILGNTPLKRESIEKWTSTAEAQHRKAEALRRIDEDGDDDDVMIDVGSASPRIEVEKVNEASPVSPRRPSPPRKGPDSDKRSASKNISRQPSKTKVAAAAEPSSKPKTNGRAESESRDDAEPEIDGDAADEDEEMEVDQQPAEDDEASEPVGKKARGKPKLVKSVTTTITTVTKSKPPKANDTAKLKGTAAATNDSSGLSSAASVEEEVGKKSKKAAAPKVVKDKDVEMPSTPKGKPGRRKRRASSSSSGSSSDTPPVTSITRTFTLIDQDNIIVGRSRRAAAGRATALLAQQMPDANKFALELKGSGKKRRRSSQQPQSSARAGGRREQTESADEDGNEDDDEQDEPRTVVERGREKKKRAGKKDTPVAEEEEDSDEEEEKEVAVVVRPPKKKQAKEPKAVAPKKASRLAQVTQGETTQEGAISSFDNPPKGKPPVKATKRKTMIMSTGTGLDAKHPDIKALKSLGASWTDSPSQVTHLVVKAMSRTEKFLCCLAAAPFIVTKEWIDASIDAGRLVDETPYLLQDRAKEKEINDTLTAILDRARARKLFDGITVYVTKSVQPDPATMQRILQSGNATVVTAKLSSAYQQAILRDREHSIIVSCGIDRQQWEPLAAKGVPIYSVEAVFQSVLLQNMTGFEDDRNNRIDGHVHDR